MTTLMVLLNGASVLESGAQWLRWESVRLGIEGLLVGASPWIYIDSLCKCLLEKVNLSAAKWYWFDPGRQEIIPA